MSERHSAGSATHPPRPTFSPPRPPIAAPLSWDHVFPSLTPDCQASILRTAATHGSVPTRLIPPLPANADLQNRAERFLARVFSGTSLPPFEPAPLSNPDRPPSEFHAISAALACPDLFLIESPTGSHRVNLVADLAVELARSGERVLVLTATAGMSDAILARLAEHHPTDPCVIAGRAVAPAESAAHLPPVSAARTARAHGEGIVQAARRRAEADAAQADEETARLEKLPASLEAIGESLAELDRLAATESTLATPPELPADFEPLRVARDNHTRELAGFDESARKLAAERDAKDAELTQLREEIARLADSKKGSGVVGILKGWFAKDETPARLAELQQAMDSVEAAIRDADTATEKLATARKEAESRHLAELDTLTREELARLDTVRSARLSEVATQRAKVEESLSAHHGKLATAGFPVANHPTPDDLETLRTRIGEARKRAATSADLARGWAQELAGNPGDFAARFLAQVRVVVGPAPSAGVDPLILTSHRESEPGFDRLLLAEADHLGEPEFHTAARLALRWVLVGDVASAQHSRPGASRNGRNPPAPPRPGLFAKLWQTLHRRTWFAEDSSVVARFHDVPRSALRCEPLADRPDIELRFAELSTGEEVLAEVRFPPDLGTADAKSFLASELTEVRLAPCGPVRWHEDPDRVTACWPAAEAAARSPIWVDLQAGVREKVVGLGPDALTAAVIFDKSAGWSRDSATDWVTRHAAGVLGSRTAVCRPAAPDAIAIRATAGVAG